VTVDWKPKWKPKSLARPPRAFIIIGRLRTIGRNLTQSGLSEGVTHGTEGMAACGELHFPNCVAQ
jgi:hypothetical protein